jgi:5-methylcytosine-specific restriction enzyme A
MAKRARRLCRLQGCRNLTRDPSGYCQSHKKGFRKAKGDDKTGDPFYSSRRWLELRDWYKAGHPVCEICQENLTEIIHHRKAILDGGSHFGVDNLQGVCRGCHNRLHHSVD